MREVGLFGFGVGWDWFSMSMNLPRLSWVGGFSEAMVPNLSVRREEHE